MGSIKEEITIVGIFKTKLVNALFDSGAYRNYIKRELSDGDTVELIGYNTYEGEQRVVLADMTVSKGEKIKFKELKIQNLCEIEPEFIIMDNLLEDVIIGVYLMQKLCIGLDPKNEKITTLNDIS